jgi:hypothetical protein
MACIISLPPQAIESFLMHVFRLEQDGFCQIGACSQPIPYFPGFSHKSVKLTFLLAGVCEVTAGTA